jgi:hypothetical protein
MKKMKMKFAGLFVAMIALFSFGGAAFADSYNFDYSGVPSYDSSMQSVGANYSVPGKVNVTVYQDSYNVKIRLDNNFGGSTVNGYKLTLTRAGVLADSFDNTIGKMYVGDINLITMSNIAVRGTQMQLAIYFPGYGTKYLYFTR